MLDREPVRLIRAICATDWLARRHEQTDMRPCLVAIWLKRYMLLTCKRSPIRQRCFDSKLPHVLKIIVVTKCVLGSIFAVQQMRHGHLRVQRSSIRVT